ncbi:arylsulfatase [Pontiella sp.]|uniref:arylsulfatase n=1 Tax=Pontiella sp. TaxID=2837462 RepID=UPI0035671029
MKTVHGLFLPMVATIAVLMGTANAAERPNIILIMSDDMGYSDIGCYGGEINTPNLDGLAANGLRYSQFYNSARCCPTRASLLTGLHPHQTGIGHMVEDKGFDGYRGDLNEHCLTIAEVLKPAGYSTYMSGKWHVTKQLFPEDESGKSNWPRQRGFERFYGTILGAGSLWDPTTLVRGNTHITPDNDPEYRPAEPWYYTDAISDNAVRYIREHPGNNPFFMYVAYTAAHWPMHARERDIVKYKGMYDDGFEPIRKARYEKLKELGLIQKECKRSPTIGNWDKVKDKAWEARNMEVYAAMVDAMDQGIGRIVAELKKQGELENTLILFLQDNGGCAEGGKWLGRGDGGQPRADKPTLPPMDRDELQMEMKNKKTRDGWPVRKGVGVMAGPPDTYISYGKEWANVSNTPFKEYKHYVHEGGISTPLIAHWPKGIKRKNRIEHQPGQIIDIMATCVDLSGARYPSEFKGHEITPMQGTSLVPTFDGGAIDRDTLYFEHEGNRAIRKGKWKLVAKGANGAWQLYDMDADRSEMNDLAKSNPERVLQLAKEWNDWAVRALVTPGPYDKEVKK